MPDILAFNSDGQRLHVIDLANVANYAEALDELPDLGPCDCLPCLLAACERQPEATRDAWWAEHYEQMVRRAVDIPTARLLEAVKDVGEPDV